jgi:hypothetical protein
MAYGFDLAAMAPFTDELSYELVSKAVLTTKELDYVNVRTGLAAGTVQVTQLDADFLAGDLSCGWTSDGQVSLTPYNIVIRDKEFKTQLCAEDLRSIYQSMKMNPSAYGSEEIPTELQAALADIYTKKVQASISDFIMKGDGVAAGLTAQITGANGANVPAGATAWTLSNAIEQALDLVDAIGAASAESEDLVMFVSPANFRTLSRSLVSQNLYHYVPSENPAELIIPGTNVKVIKSSGLVGSDRVFAGKKSDMIFGTGLESDFSAFNIFYDASNDVTKIKIKFREGILAINVDQFATNDLV